MLFIILLIEGGFQTGTCTYKCEKISKSSIMQIEIRSAQTAFGPVALFPRNKPRSVTGAGRSREICKLFREAS